MAQEKPLRDRFNAWAICPRVPVLLVVFILWALLLLEAKPLLDSGTLGVIVATKEGVVVASDTRQTLGNGQFCDGANKILDVKNSGGLLLMVSGRRGFYPIQMSLAPDPCSFARTTQRDIDIAQIAKDYIEKNFNNVDLEAFDLAALSQRCVSALVDYFKRAPYYHPSATRDPFSSSIVLVKYDPTRQRSIVRSVELSVSSDLTQLSARTGLNESFDLDQLSEPIVLGEGAYLQQTVLPRLGSFSVGASTLDEIGSFPQTKFPKVKHRSREHAIELVIDLISAASQSTETVPARSGIGGPIEVFFLGSNGAARVQ